MLAAVEMPDQRSPPRPPAGAGWLPPVSAAGALLRLRDHARRSRGVGADEIPCDFLPIGVEGATLDAQGPDTHAECVADLLLGERTAAGDEFIGVFSVIITHESWGAIDDVYRTTSAGGTPTDLGDEGVLKTFPAVATDAYGAYFLKGPYSVSVEHTVMDPNFFVEDTALTKALTETLARAIDSSMDAAGVGASSGRSRTGVAPPPPGGTGSAGDPTTARRSARSWRRRSWSSAAQR